MSGEFSLISIEHLAHWALSEYEESRAIFGIHESLFFRPQAADPFRMRRYGTLLETPIGVAAGPHTQMAQNIITAWLCGARYMELKTVQTLDELNVSKPCIDMEDEGYNCEWSQELKLDDSFSEYLNAWILLHVLRHKLGWDAQPERGFIFNLSVGYNMEGILKDNVQRFFAHMADCRAEKEARVAALTKIYPQIRDIEIPDCISDNITLSTMHGCPPEEIERIGTYLITEKKLHTAVKLNPTLLGPQELRQILNKELGFETTVPDEAFAHDLKYPDALVLIRNLRERARENGVEFGLKLTNTLECINHKSVFPANEKMMYMSGRALHPISVRVAAKLQTEFEGGLDISFSAGGDAYNLPDILACGIRPVTVCSDVLKPGGYARLLQYLDPLRQTMQAAGAESLEAWVTRGPAGNALGNLQMYAAGITEGHAARKDAKSGDLIKTKRELPAFDCVQAPCVVTCPTNQAIPEYMYHASRGDYRAGMEAILRTNPFPTVCGMVCDHPCQFKCTRMNYDNPLLIREIKRFLAEQAPPDSFKLQPAASNGLKAAVIGAGPSGLTCAYFLALAGFSVEVHETKAFSGGMLSDAIPAFRLTNEAIQHDIDHICSLGVQIHYNSKIDVEAFAALRERVDYVYLAIGAQGAKRLGVAGEDAPGSLDCLQFLAHVRQGRSVKLGKRVAIIGGGNSAIDAARTAWRLVSPEGGSVTVLYRRTRREMPAEAEEIVSMLAEGVQLVELCAPTAMRLEEGRVVAVVAERMRLGEPDQSGRRRPVRIPDSTFEVPVDTLIGAIGQDVIPDFITDPAVLKTDGTTYETGMPKVFAGGDAVRGAATVIEAIGDGRKAAESITRVAMQRDGLAPTQLTKQVNAAQHQQLRATRCYGREVPETGASSRGCFDLVTRTLTPEEAKIEASRCLFCDDVCDQCVTVCPNRSNLSYRTTPRDYPLVRLTSAGLESAGTFRVTQPVQILNIGDFCNECGNCTTFCPTKGDPYRDKPKFYLTQASFQHEKDGYHITEGGRALQARVDGQEASLARENGSLVYKTNQVTAHLSPGTLKVTQAKLEPEAKGEVDLSQAVHMGVLLEALQSAAFVM